MEIRGLGYMGVGASDLSDWTSFATNWLGMQMIERGNTARAFRMDDREQRLVVDRSLPKANAISASRSPTRPRCNPWPPGLMPPASRSGRSQSRWRISGSSRN